MTEWDSADTEPITTLGAEVIEPITVDSALERVPTSIFVRDTDTAFAGACLESLQDCAGAAAGSCAIPELTAQLGAVLLNENMTIAVAESLTGGELAAEIVRVPGISASFQGGTVAYQHAAKRELLGVDSALLASVGAVHPEVAEQMARGVRRQFSFANQRPVDIGISTTGAAGPDPSDGRDPGTVYLGIDSIFGMQVIALDFGALVRAEDPIGTRMRVRHAAVEAAVRSLLEHVRGGIVS